MAKEENYYEILKNLEIMLGRILNANIHDCYEIYSDVQSLIFKYDTLKSHFIPTVKKVFNLSKSSTYSNMIKHSYSKVKKYITSNLEKRDVKIAYLDDLIKDFSSRKISVGFYEEFPSVVEYTSKIKEKYNKKYFENTYDEDEKRPASLDDWYKCCDNFFTDVPSLYLYQSLISLILENFEDSDNADVKFKIGCGLYDFYKKNFGYEFTDLIEFPQNIEYLIVAMGFGKRLKQMNNFNFGLSFSSLFKVVKNLIFNVKEEIDKCFGFVIPKIPSEENIKHKVFINIEDNLNVVKVDGIPVEGLNTKKIHDILGIWQRKYLGQPIKKRSYISRINDLFTPLIDDKYLYDDVRLIRYSEEHKRYVINTKVYEIDAPFFNNIEVAK